jgi:hypothetical protein
VYPQVEMEHWEASRLWLGMIDNMERQLDLVSIITSYKTAFQTLNTYGWAQKTILAEHLSEMK